MLVCIFYMPFAYAKQSDKKLPQMTKYNSKDHPKALGLNISIDIPKSWYVKTNGKMCILMAKSKNTLKCITSGITLSVVKLPNPQNIPPKEFEKNVKKDLALISPSDLFKMSEYSQTATLLKGEKITINGHLAFMLLIEETYNTHRVTIYDRHLIINISYKNLIVVATMGTKGAIAHDFDDAFPTVSSNIIKQVFSRTSDIFSHSINSIEINEK